MNKQRFYVDTEGNDDEAYREAMQLAAEIANANSEIKSVVILIHTKSNTGWFGRLFGTHIVSKLFKGVKFENCDAQFKFETVKTYKEARPNSEIVITCGLDSKEVLDIEDFNSINAIIAIPWLKTDLKKWIQTWNPIEIRGKQLTDDTSYLEPSCIVKVALKELTESINMSTGIRHPSDEDLAKTFILALHKYEPSIDKDIIGAYLLKELGWSTEYAKDVEKLVETLNSGKYFKGGNRVGLKQYYIIWSKECNEH